MRDPKAKNRIVDSHKMLTRIFQEATSDETVYLLSHPQIQSLLVQVMVAASSHYSRAVDVLADPSTETTGLTDGMCALLARCELVEGEAVMYHFLPGQMRLEYDIRSLVQVLVREQRKGQTVLLPLIREQLKIEVYHGEDET